MRLIEDAGFSKDLGVQSKVLFIAWFEAVTYHPVNVRDRECGRVNKAKHGSWAPPRARNPWEELSVSNIVGVYLCRGLQAFPGRWPKPTALPQLKKVSQAQRGGLSTRAVDPEPLGSWPCVRVHSGGGQEEQGLRTGGSRRLRFWSLVLGLFSSFDCSLNIQHVNEYRLILVRLSVKSCFRPAGMYAS